MNEEKITEWTPCKDQLPKEPQEYFITWVGTLGKRRMKPFISISEFMTDETWDISVIKALGYTDIEVTAWMNLPDPYEES